MAVGGHFKPQSPGADKADESAQDAMMEENFKLKEQLAALRHNYRLVALQSQLAMNRNGFSAQASKRAARSLQRVEAKTSIRASPSKVQHQLTRGASTKTTLVRKKSKKPAASPKKATPSQTTYNNAYDNKQKENPLYVDTDSDDEDDNAFGFGGDDASEGDGEMTEDQAATKIQAQFRGHKARKEEKEQVQAATKIQAQFRGHKARKEEKEQVQAATKIQAQFRGHQARKSLSEEGNADGTDGMPRKASPKPVKEVKEGKRFALKAPLRNGDVDPGDENQKVLKHRVSLKFSNDSPEKTSNQPGPPSLSVVDNIGTSGTVVDQGASQARMENVDFSFNFDKGHDPTPPGSDDEGDFGAAISALERKPSVTSMKRPSLIDNSDEENEEDDNAFGFDDADFDDEFSDDD